MPSVQLHKPKVEKANTATLLAVTRAKRFLSPAEVGKQQISYLPFIYHLGLSLVSLVYLSLSFRGGPV